PRSWRFVPPGPGRMLGCISPGPVIGPSTVGMSGTAAWAAASHAASVTAETRAPVRATQRRIVKLKLLPPFEMLMRFAAAHRTMRGSGDRSGKHEWAIGLQKRPRLRPHAASPPGTTPTYTYLFHC